MKPQSVIFSAVAAALLLMLFIAGAVYVNRTSSTAPQRPTPLTATATPDAPAIVEASPAPDATPDAYSASRVIPTPPSFSGAEGDAATDRVTLYLRWVAEMEIRRRMALSELNGLLGNSSGDWGHTLEQVCKGNAPPHPSPDLTQEREALRQAESNIAHLTNRYNEIAQEAKAQTAPPELERFHRAYGDFVQWNGDVVKALADREFQTMQAAMRGDQEGACKQMTRYMSMMQEMGDQDARLKRLLADMNKELDAVRAQHPDLPNSLRSLKIEMP